MSSEQLLVTE